MNKLYDLCVATRTYKSNGQDKTNWENVGALLQNDDGKKFIMLKAHFNPAAIQRKEGSESIVISMFKPKQKQDNQQQQQRNSNNSNSSNDDAGWNYDDSQSFGGDNIDDFPF